MVPNTVLGVLGAVYVWSRHKKLCIGIAHFLNALEITRPRL